MEKACLFIEASPYAGIVPDRDAIAALFRQLLVVGCVLVNDAGFLAGTITPMSFAPSIKIASELAWWAPGANGTAFREMFEVWAKEHGAAGVHMTTLNNEYAPRLAKNLTENGYTPIEVAYLKAI